ncbi:flavin monoamine oxidase family protein [Granulosicoccus sp. 3-233]|uniref:flavin monoamine oxidase family protein n=1 Tax=Granulosicoccus sp. 3-233 TaxID=3417969 RepID=UPI003D342176
MQTRTDAPAIIVGGGLSGLCAAFRLQQLGISYRLLEARDRLGGRILTTDDSHIDLGPSWFWPGQRQIAELISELGLQDGIYPQASDGLSVMEYADGTLQKSHGGASMAGSNRLEGGMQRLITALADTLPAERIKTSSQVRHIEQTRDGITLRVEQAGEDIQLSGRLVILALPPRVAANTIHFQPGLPSKDGQVLERIPTWMAAQCKIIAEYDAAFWLADGLSGDGFSQLGPLGEVHDASPRHGDTHALFGFVAVPPAQRQGQDDALKQAAIEQLVRMFGEAASTPVAVHLQDWAFDGLTATALDRSMQIPHGHARPTLSSEWNKRVLWAGTETAGLTDHSNGYLEGAVEAGNRAATLVATLNP